MPKKKRVFRVPTYHPDFDAFQRVETIRQIAESYDPKLHVAPLKAGHKPTPGAPAFAWFQEIEAEGNFLKVAFDTDQLTRAGYDAIQSGNFRTLSPEFYHPQSPYNPKPGKWYFKALAFLGADAPAGKGIDTITTDDLAGFNPPTEWKASEVLAFNEDEEPGKTFVVFDHAQDEKFKNNLNSGGQVDKLKKIIQAAIKGLVADDKLAEFTEKIAPEIAKLLDVTSFSESDKAATALVEALAKAQTAVFAEQGKNETTAAELKTAQDRLATFAENERKGGIEALFKRLREKGKLPPKLKDAFVRFCEAVTSGKNEVVFSEGGKETKRSLLEELETLFSEIVPEKTYTPSTEELEPGKKVEFAEENASIEGVLKRNQGGKNG